MKMDDYWFVEHDCVKLVLLYLGVGGLGHHLKWVPVSITS